VPARAELGTTVGVRVEPQTALFLKVLALPRAGLGAWLAEAVERNPFLAWRGGDADGWSGAAADDASARAGAGGLSGSPALERVRHLIEQLPPLDVDSRRIAFALAAAVDVDGYLGWPLEVVAQRLGVPTRAVAAVHRRLLACLEPAGVLARDRREAAAAILRRRPQHAAVRDALSALKAGLEPDAGARALAAAMGWPPARARAAACCLQSLPAEPWPREGVPAPSALPDFRLGPDGEVAVEVRARAWVELDRAYARLPARVLAAGGHDAAFVRVHRREARLVLAALVRRDATMARVGQALLGGQAAFARLGPRAILPRRVEDVSRHLGLHPSTVWRAAQDKWVATPHGTLPVRAFIGRRVRDGGTVGAATLAASLRAIVADEPPDRPLTDGELAARLFALGMAVERRTVAKYRALAGIPPSRARRRA
jgi:RNA polymerase sigma-54 factor